MGGLSLPTFESEYQAILDKVDLETFDHCSNTFKLKGNQLIIDLKAAGLLAKALLGYVFHTNGSGDLSNMACINWKNPSANLLTKMGGANLSFANLAGFNSLTDDATAGYLKTGYMTGSIPSANDMTYAMKPFVNLAANGASFGVRDASATRHIYQPRTGANGAEGRIASSTNNTLEGSVVDSTRRLVMKKTSSTNRAHSFNGGAFANLAVSGSAGTSLEIYLLAVNESGALYTNVASPPSKHGLEYWWMFNGAFSDAEKNAWDAAIANYLS